MRKPIRGKTWEEVECFDDAIQDSWRKEIERLEEEFADSPKCPLLRKEGNSFYFCGIGVNEYSNLPRSKNPAFRNRLEPTRLKKCFSDYSECTCFYIGEFYR